jgi:hypothetical protein
MSSQFGNRIISASAGSAFIVIGIFMSFSLTSTEAQNMTNQTGGQQQPQPPTIISKMCLENQLLSTRSTNLLIDELMSLISSCQV